MSEPQPDPFGNLIALLQPTLILLVISQAVFASFPGIDLAVSSWFYSETQGFWLNDLPGLQGLRDVFYNMIFGIFLVCLAMFSLGRRIAPFKDTPRRVWGLGAIFMLLGPGVVVNTIFKTHWGRARPDTVIDFGGNKLFTPAFEFTDQCARNCSFVSGEAAGLAAMAIVIWLIGRSIPQAKWFRWVTLTAILIAIAGSVFRLIKGRHFLSDITLGPLMMMVLAIVMAMVWQYFLKKRA